MMNQLRALVTIGLLGLLPTIASGQITAGSPSATTDTDDASVAVSQTAGLQIGLGHAYDGSVWRRVTFGTAGTASAQVWTVQGIASMTPLQVTAPTGSSISTVINGINGGSTTSFDTGVVGTNTLRVTLATNVNVPVTGAVTVSDGAGALNIICDSGCTPGGSFADNAAFTFGSTAINVAGYVFDDAATNAATENSAAAPRMAANRVPYSTLRDAAGNERGANVTAGNALVVDGSASTQPVSGTVTVTDGAGAMNVICDSGCAGGTSDADDASIAAGQTTGIQLGLSQAFDGTVWRRLTFGTAGTASAQVWTVQGVASMTPLLVDGSAVTQPVSGTFWQATQPVSGTVTVTDGAGAMNAIIDSGTITSVSQLGGVALPVEDAGETAAGVGIYAMSVRRDAAASSAGTTGDNATLNTNASGALWVAQVDPCSSGTKVFVAISQTTGTQLFAGTASNRTYVCHISIVTATAQNIALVSGTGTVCATSTGAMMGGTTAATGWNFAANGGIAAGGGGASIAKSDTDADNVCLLQSASGQISGVISYVVAAN